MTANPEPAAKLISPKGTAEDHKAIADLIRANERLGMNLQPASAVRKEINQVYKAGEAINLLPRTPDPSTIYGEPLQ